MNSLKKLWVLGGASLLALGGIIIPHAAEGDGFVDPIHYETPVPEVFHAAYAEDDATPAAEVKKLVFHYYNTDKKNGTRELYTWVGGIQHYTSFVQDSDDTTGAYYHVELDFTSAHSAYAGKTSINFIVKYIGTWDGQSQDCEIVFDEFAPDANGTVEVWTCSGQKGAIDIFKTKAETQMAKVTSAYFTNWKTIHAIADEKPKLYRLYALDKTYLAASDAMQDRIKESRLIKSGAPTSKNFDIQFNYTAHINMQYVLETEYESHTRTQSVIVTSNKLYNDSNFKQYYTYTGNDLGAVWAKDKTTFKVWAPTAGAIMLNIYNGGTPAGYGKGITAYTAVRQYMMTMQPGGVWEKTLLTPEGSDSLSGKYYTYTVYNSEGVNEICDPYAHACGVNGKRGMILDFSSTNPDGWNNLPLKWDKTERDIKTPQELSIYEVHIRDLTEDSTWVGNARNGSFPAFYESGTRYTKNGTTVKTGFDHIEEMGVTAVQIMPMYDQDNSEMFYYFKDGSDEQVNVDYNKYTGDKTKLQLDYNWGYNPLNYNCIEGSYSSDPFDGAKRVKEFKELVLAYANNKNKTRITMDVVYNHVSSVSKSNFTKLMPLYYFRFNEAADEYWNGSGCSNEVKSEAPMMRKFIVDSLCWWATEYKVKGFRFDLMELIDMDTLNEARKALYKIDPDIYIYGEGWKAADSGLEGNNGGGNTGNVYAKAKEANGSIFLGAFNDGGRNALKGGNDGGNIGHSNFYWDNGAATPTTGSGYKDYPLNIGGWAAAGASIFVHAWKTDTDTKDYKLTDNSKLRIYNGYENFVLVRMSGDASALNWETKWGQSGDMTVGNGTLTFKDWGTIRTPGTSSFMSSGGFEVNVGQMMTGYNPNTTQTQDPRQTVNYASCHDNFTLYDQFSWSLGSGQSTTDTTGAPTTASVMKAVSATECAVALSNGVAFVLGGDELLRTKIEDDPENSREGEDFVRMYGKCISHNSYKSSTYTNSFKWDRKISVTGYKGTATNTAWSQIAAALTRRQSFQNFTTYSNSTKSGDDVNYWNASDNHVSWNNGSIIMTLNGAGSWTISY